MNRVTILGNLGADPEVRHLQNGDKVANLRVAVTEKWKDKTTGERKEATEWIPVTLFGPLAGIADQYLRKGSKALIEGKFRTRKWQDQHGNDRYSTEVVCSGPSATLQMLDAAPQTGQRQTADSANSFGAGGGYGGGMDDSEIPF